MNIIDTLKTLIAKCKDADQPSDTCSFERSIGVLLSVNEATSILNALKAKPEIFDDSNSKNYDYENTQLLDIDAYITNASKYNNSKPFIPNKEGTYTAKDNDGNKLIVRLKGESPFLYVTSIYNVNQDIYTRVDYQGNIEDIVIEYTGEIK